MLTFAPSSSETGTISWTITNPNPGYQVYLQKVSSKENAHPAIDLTDADANPISVSGAMSFELLYGPRIVDVIPAMTRGWNLISFPCVMTQSLNSIFPNLIQKSGWFWDGKIFRSIGNDKTFIPNCGYWVYFEKNTSVTQIEGVSGNSRLDIEDGWNLTGSPREILLLSQLPNSANILSVWQYDSADTQFQKVTGSLNFYRGLWMYQKQ